MKEVVYEIEKNNADRILLVIDEQYFREKQTYSANDGHRREGIRVVGKSMRGGKKINS